MAITQDVTVVNDLGNAALERRDRVTSAGPSARYTVTFESQPILHDWAALKSAPHAAAAILQLLQTRIRGISAEASVDTETRRDRYARELVAGGSAARKRYSGGRIGTLAPKRASAKLLFQDSGRLADGLLVRIVEGVGFTINVPANRFDPKTFGGGEPAIVSMWQRLASLVPEFRGGAEVTKHDEVQRAIAQDVTDSIFVAGERAAATARKARSRLAATVLKDVVRVLSIGA